VGTRRPPLPDAVRGFVEIPSILKVTEGFEAVALQEWVVLPFVAYSGVQPVAFAAIVIVARKDANFIGQTENLLQ